MVEEDRQTALSMYSRLFDNAQDEEQLMDLLVSPTRQAVVIARTYDARERKQQLESPKPEDHEQTPAFVLAIDKIYQQVAPKAPEPRPLPEEKEEGPVSQFSLFPDDAHPIDDSEYVPFQIEAQAVPLEPGVEELPEESPVRGAEKAEESYVPGSRGGAPASARADPGGALPRSVRLQGAGGPAARGAGKEHRVAERGGL